VSGKPDFVYVTYVKSTPDLVWEALTDPGLSGEYWGHENVSDWRPGSAWEHRRTDGSGVADVVGEVLEASPPSHLVITFDPPGPEPPGGPSKVTFEIAPFHDIVRLTVLHENLADGRALAAISSGWPAVLSNLKSLLETGSVLPRPPWEMEPELRAAQMARNDPGPGSATDPTTKGGRS
jgi:uncharacterized protein YndB with AHSA1/START domain